MYEAGLSTWLGLELWVTTWTNCSMLVLSEELYWIEEWSDNWLFLVCSRGWTGEQVEVSKRQISATMGEGILAVSGSEGHWACPNWPGVIWERRCVTASCTGLWTPITCVLTESVFVVSVRAYTVYFLGNFRTPQPWDLCGSCWAEECFLLQKPFSHSSFPAPLEGGTMVSICSGIHVLSASYAEHPRSCGGGRLGSPFRSSLLCCANHTLSTFHILFLGAKHKEPQHQQQFLWQPVSPPPHPACPAV